MVNVRQLYVRLLGVTYLLSCNSLREKVKSVTITILTGPTLPIIIYFNNSGSSY